MRAAANLRRDPAFATSRAIPMLVTCLLAGCGPQDQQFQGLILDRAPAPGAYDETIVTHLQADGAEPRIDEDRKSHCLNDGADPVRDALTRKSDSLCVGPALTFRGGRISGTQSCFWSSGATERMTVEYSGHYDPRRIELVLTAWAPGGSVRQVRTLVRTGQCLTNAEAISDAIARNDWSIAENSEASR